MLINDKHPLNNLEKVSTIFNAFLENTHNIIIIFDKHGKYILTSKKTQEILGRNQEEIEGRTFSELLPQETAELFYQRLERLKANQSAFTVEDTIHTNKGKRTFETMLFPIEIIDGQLEMCGSIAWEVTERKQAKEDLKRSEEKFRTYVENAPVAIFVVDGEGNFIEVNREACRMRGYTKKELLNLRIPDIVHPDHAQLAREHFEKVKRDGSSEGTLLGQRKDGDLFWYDNYAVKVSEDMFISFQTDVTERVERERKLQENEEKFRTLFEQNMLGIYLHDFDGNIIDVNREACSQLGYEREVLLNMSVFDFIYTKEFGGYLSKQEILSIWNQMELGERTTVEDMHQRQDGSVIQVEVSTGVVKYNNKNVIMALTQDITERKQSERKLQETNQALKMKQQQIDKELEKARQIHEDTLLGKYREVGSPESISLEAHYYPAERIGGDLYDFVRTEDKLIIYLSDVTGHGVEAAIISTFVKETIENYVELETGRLAPEAILTHVYKQYIKKGFPEDYFVSLFLAVLDLNTYTLSYTAAGVHFPPFVKLANGAHITLQSEGPPISGAIEQALMNFRTDSVTLYPGSIVLFYTDGIAEQTNDDKHIYGERLKNTFYAQPSKYPPELIKQVINNDFLDFNGSLQGGDDITYVILQIKPPERQEYYWELRSTVQEVDDIYAKIFPVISECVKEASKIQGLYELIVNAMEHGNNCDSDKKIYIRVVLTSDYVFATVEDEGDGFNWREKMAANTQNIIESHKERGRGILMAKLLCDGLLYNEKGNKAFVILESPNSNYSSSK